MIGKEFTYRCYVHAILFCPCKWQWQFWVILYLDLLVCYNHQDNEKWIRIRLCVGFESQSHSIFCHLPRRLYKRNVDQQSAINNRAKYVLWSVTAMGSGLFVGYSNVNNSNQLDYLPRVIDDGCVPILWKRMTPNIHLLWRVSYRKVKTKAY